MESMCNTKPVWGMKFLNKNLETENFKSLKGLGIDSTKSKRRNWFNFLIFKKISAKITLFEKTQNLQYTGYITTPYFIYT